MAHDRQGERQCSACGERFPYRDLVAGEAVHGGVAKEIRRDHPGGSDEGPVCLKDLTRYRAKYVRTLLRAERGELSALEHEVLESLEKQETVATHVDQEFDQARTFGERLADRIADFGGSWTFLILFAVFIALWIAGNSLVLYWRPSTPIPTSSSTCSCPAWPPFRHSSS